MEERLAAGPAHSVARGCRLKPADRRKELADTSSGAVPGPGPTARVRSAPPLLPSPRRSDAALQPRPVAAACPPCEQTDMFSSCG